MLYYTMSVENSVTSLVVTATPKFGNTSVNISGNQKLYPGVNYIKVHATGADGVMSTYVVEVNREATPSSNISIHPKIHLVRCRNLIPHFHNYYIDSYTKEGPLQKLESRDK
ncbi:cadherin-like beta sandwich domain-containing protein [Erysipelothrix sp. D19-032]